MKVTVITISDRAFKGTYEDKSGNIIESIILDRYKDTSISRKIVPDEKEQILKALKESENANFIITTGGTGLSTRDITPEVCREYCDKEIPGISDILRQESYKETPMAMISRGFSGMKNKTIIINFPGSPKAVTLCTKIILPIIQHSIDMINNQDHS